MMQHLSVCSLVFSYIISAIQIAYSTSTPQVAVVHAVLFFSPSCSHCHIVSNETLPPLFEKYGEQLDLVSVDVTQPGGQVLFGIVVKYFEFRNGVIPFLLIGDTCLIGSRDIPERFPGLIDDYLAQGGVDWPSIPGFVEALQAAKPTATPTILPTSAPVTAEATSTPVPELWHTSEHTARIWTVFSRDLQGNVLSVLVLLIMILSIGGAAIYFRRTTGTLPGYIWQWSIPILCLIGLGVASYLAYVETTQTDAVCGPVGDCNTVQQSEFARLYGILPVGILGVVGYIAISLAWIIRCFAERPLASYASLAMFAMTTFGVLFSIYLTFLEPFVIGATCAWCLTSAILMTVLFWLSLAPARAAVLDLRPHKLSLPKDG